MTPREKGSAMWNGAEKLNNKKPESSVVDVATWRMTIAEKTSLE